MIASRLNAFQGATRSAAAECNERRVPSADSADHGRVATPSNTICHTVHTGPGNPRTPREQRPRSQGFGTGFRGSRTGAQPCQGRGRVTVQPLARVERPGDTNPVGGQATDPNERCRPTPARPRSLLVRPNKIRSTARRFTRVSGHQKVERNGGNPPLPSFYKTAALPLC
jgi:hypothetical protein